MVPWIKNGTLAYARTLAKLRMFITLMVKNDFRIFAGAFAQTIWLPTTLSLLATQET